MDKLNSNTVVQIGIIVKDVAKTADHYADLFGIPTPAIVPIADDPFAKTQYLGQPSSAKGKAAFFHLGSIEMELIEPVGGPSTWEEFLYTHGEGVHHLAIKTKDIDAAQELLALKGMGTVQTGGWDGGQYAYVDSTEQLGTILELLKFDK